MAVMPDSAGQIALVIAHVVADHGSVIEHGPWTGANERHNGSCHARWHGQLNRRTGQTGYEDAWYDEQCGGCRYWIALQGTLGHDYGACTHALSAFDGQVRFEHDGCVEFTEREDGSFG